MVCVCHRGRCGGRGAFCYQTFCRFFAVRLLIEPTILFPLGTSVVSAKGAYDNVTEVLCVLTVVLCSPLPCRA